MFKKSLCAVMAILFALLAAFPAAALDRSNPTTIPYTAGYTILNYYFFYTQAASKPTTEPWFYVTDDNTETYYYDGNGIRYNGKHYTCVCWGTTVISNTVTVYFGNTKSIYSFVYNNQDYTYLAPNLRLKISNGSDLGLGYQTQGDFIACYGNFTSKSDN